MREENHVMEIFDVSELTALSGLGLQTAEAMKKVRETMCLICPFRNVDF